MTESRVRFCINLIASFCAFFLSMGIGFVLTPYIVRNVSVEAYGFVGLSNSMVEYASILTVALNSVAGRFITISWHKNKHEEAADIMSSVVITNMGIAGLLLLTGGIAICFLEYIIDIPVDLMLDVKILFAVVLVNFCLAIVNAVFSVSTFITDKLYLTSSLNIVTAILRVMILVGLFYLFPANIVYVGFAALVCTVVELLVNIWYKRKLVPDLKISWRRFRRDWVKRLFSAGIWSSLTKFSQILSDGLDLLISNLWLGAYLMGQLSISKVISMAASAMLARISALYAPRLTRNFALNNIDLLIHTLKVNMKMTGFVANIIYAEMVSMGTVFFDLWLPHRDTIMIYQLAVLSLSGMIVSGAINGLYTVFLITNRLKVNSLFWFCMGLFDFIVVLLLLNYTDIGVYAVAGTSIVVGFFANLLFVPLYAAKCLKVKMFTFYDVILRYMSCTIGMTVVFLILAHYCFDMNREWQIFIKNCLFLMVIGIVINVVLLLNREERQLMWNTLKCRFVKWRDYIE